MKKTYLLEDFGFLSISGPDAVKFFQGYCTCDLTQLNEFGVLPGATCNLQGRMVANFLIKMTENGILLRLNKSLVPKLTAYLKKYIVFSKAEMSDLSESLFCYGVTGDQALAPQSRYFATQLGSTLDTLIQVSGDSQARHEIWCESESNDPLESELSPWLSAEIADGYAWTDLISSEEYLPQMFNLHTLGGIDFEKGCYLGQEIIARMHFRGQLKKTLHRGEANRHVNVGDEIFIATQDSALKSVGKIVTSQDNHFLAVIQTKSSSDLDLFLEDRSPIKATNLSA